MIDTGVAHGRFQIFHNDHLKYLQAAKARCRHLVVAITNPDPTLTKFDPADPGRSSPERNPLSYYERYRIIKRALQEQDWSPEEFSIVPLPINFPDLYQYYVPLTATFFLTIYDDWGERKLQMFQSLGLTTEVLWRRPLAEKGLTGYGNPPFDGFAGGLGPPGAAGRSGNVVVVQHPPTSRETGPDRITGRSLVARAGIIPP